MAAKNKKSKRDFVEEIFQSPEKVTKRIPALFDLKKYPSRIKKQVKFSLPASFDKVRPAIDIGPDSIKVVQLTKKGKDNYEIAVLDQESLDKGQNKKPVDYQKEALRKIIKRNHLGKNCTIGLSASEIRTYNMTFPNMSEDELKTAVSFKLSRLSPFNLNVKNITYRFTKWTDKGLGIGSSNVLRVMAVCCSSETINNKVLLLKKAGLRPVSVEASSLALLNLTKYNAPQSFRRGVSLWLNLGCRKSSLVIEKNSFILYFKEIDFGTEKLFQAVSKSQSMNINQAEAEKLVKQVGLSAWFRLKQKPKAEKGETGQEDVSAEVYRLISSHLESFIVGIQHSFKYFSYQATQSQITAFDRIFITGGGAGLEKMDKFLSTNLEAPVEKADFFSIFALSPELGKDKRDLAENSLDFSQAGSLAMSPILKDYKQLNFLEPKHKNIIGAAAKAVMKNTFSKITTIVVLFLLILTTAKVVDFQRAKSKAMNVKKKLKAMERKIDQRISSQLELSQEKSKIIEERNKLKDQISYFSKENDFSNNLIVVTGLIPDKLWIDKISLEQKELNIAGSTPDINKVVNLVEELKRKKNFVHVDFVYSKKGKKTGIYNFEINIQIKG